MSTRGIAGFILDGKTIASYNHSDSYPSWLGKKVLGFARTVSESTAEQVRAVRLVPEDGVPNATERTALADLGIEARSVSTGRDWYSALRGTQGDLAEQLRVGVMLDSAAFLQDDVFCEWGYLVDLDKHSLRVYRGGPEEVIAFLLSDLPSDEAFLAALGDD